MLTAEQVFNDIRPFMNFTKKNSYLILIRLINSAHFHISIIGVTFVCKPTCSWQPLLTVSQTPYLSPFVPLSPSPYKVYTKFNKCRPVLIPCLSICQIQPYKPQYFVPKYYNITAKISANSFTFLNSKSPTRQPSAWVW